MREFDEESSKEIVAHYLSKQLDVTDIRDVKEVVFLDIASKESIVQQYLLPLFDKWRIGVRFIFLRYVSTKYNCYRSFGLGTNHDGHITKLANILDDGFPNATTSPFGWDTDSLKPLGVVPTKRRWFHEVVTEQFKEIKTSG